MNETQFHNRRALAIENEAVRVTVTAEGGHISEILEKKSGVSPLWVPPWPSIETSSYSREKFPEYGADAESKLLSGILGHNLCLGMFGPPSPDEEAAGVNVHGEASLVPYELSADSATLTAKCKLPVAQLGFERKLRLQGRRILIEETVENLSPLDRPIAWTQHVTLGPPFLERGKTQFRVPATKSRALNESTDFDWPFQPTPNGKRDLQIYTSAEVSGGYTAHLLDRRRDRSYFFARSPASQVAIGYVWNRSDFPWIGIWEENHSRTHAPWNGRTMTRGMEFGVSPFPEPRRQMIDRGTLWDTACYRWVGGKKRIGVAYYAAIARTSSIPETLEQFEALVS
jgi:hypothetical protein